MKRLWLRMNLFWGAAMVLLPLSALSQEKGEIDARAILEKATTLHRPRTLDARVSMVVIAPNRSRMTKRFHMSTAIEESGKFAGMYLEFIAPADIAGTRLLGRLNLNGGESSDAWEIWLPDLKKVKKVVSTVGQGGRFMGSNLTYYDMGSHETRDYQYTYLREEEISFTVNGVKNPRKVWVIEARPTDDEIPYGLVVISVSQEDSFVYRSIMWDRNKKKIKTIYVAESEKDAADVVIPIRVLVIGTDGSKTLFQADNVKINYPLNDDIFTRRYLER